MNFRYSEIETPRSRVSRRTTLSALDYGNASIDLDEDEIEETEASESRSTIDILLSIEKLLREIKEQLTTKKDPSSEQLSFSEPLSNSFLQTFSPEPAIEGKGSKPAPSVPPVPRSPMLEEIQAVLSQNASMQSDETPGGNEINSTCSLTPGAYDDNI